MEKKTEHFRFRATPALKKAATKAAKADGRSLSSWLEKIVSDAATQKKAE